MVDRERLFGYHFLNKGSKEMARKLLFLSFLVALLISLVSPSLALVKEKMGSAIKLYPAYYLSNLAAEEKGFWKANGLDVEWAPLAGAAPLMSAVAAGSINVGMAPGDAPVTGADRGLPVFIVSELAPTAPFRLYVRADSPYRRVTDLKAKKIGVTTLGGTPHAFGLVMAKAVGIEKDVRFVGAGGAVHAIAGLKAGGFDANVNTRSVAVPLLLDKTVREIASTDDYLPKPWLDRAIFVRKDFARRQPDVVRNILRATLQSIDFIWKNPRWAIDKIKSFQGVPEDAAKLLYDDFQFTVTGRIDRKAVENLRKVLMEYGIISEKAPGVDDLYTNEYLP